MSSFVFTQPEALAGAASDLTGIGSSISAANTAAAPSTTSVLAAAEDEVSAAIAIIAAGGAFFAGLPFWPHARRALTGP